MDPRIAARTPVACTGCHGQYPDRVHVDFNSAFEGPVIDSANPRTTRVDWLVLCEDCVRQAHRILPNDERDDEVDRLTRQVAQLEQRAVEAETYADDLEDTLSRRPAARQAKPKTQAAGGARKNRYAPKAA